MKTSGETTGRILSTHVGSLIRPPALIPFLEAQRDKYARDEQAYKACLHDSVAEVVRRQAAIGLDVINDGEFGKNISWSRYVLERMSGFVQRPVEKNGGMPAAVVGRDRHEFAEFYAEYDRSQGFAGMSGWVVTGPVRYTGQVAIQRDIENLKAAVRGVKAVDFFMSAVAPASVAPDRCDEYYKSDEEYVFAVAGALREEYRAIVEAGFILQVDDAYLATTYEVMVPPRTLRDYRKWAAIRVEALNHALQGLPEERTRYHVCWGSWNGPHAFDVEMKRIVDLILRVKAGGYLLEMANARHEHEWRVWEEVKLPAGKVLIPGVISHATNVVEHPELVAERLVRLARLVGRENVMAGTDCGFAQGPFVQRVHPSIMWAKLISLVDGARLASKCLWKAPARTRRSS
ncbi:MAG: cobalamin-independent methionine synthase II family protein [Gammaproteobacteria bacterium]|nr:cobalamin-independent methionine synthase II family protein [Gammaproteobacteria bacterium]